jgi:hypothetical protein
MESLVAPWHCGRRSVPPSRHRGRQPQQHEALPRVPPPLPAPEPSRLHAVTVDRPHSAGVLSVLKTLGLSPRLQPRSHTPVTHTLPCVAYSTVHAASPPGVTCSSTVFCISPCTALFLDHGMGPESPPIRGGSNGSCCQDPIPQRTP